MTLNTHISGDPAEARSYVQQLIRYGERTASSVTDLHRVRAQGAGNWEGEASEGFQHWIQQQAAAGDTLAGLWPKIARALTVWADEIETVQARMEQAKQVARDGGLTLMGSNLILPPKAMTATKPVPPDGRASAEESRQHANAVAEFDAAKAAHEKQQAAWEEAKRTVHDAREKERAAHEALNRAMDTAKEDLRGIPQVQKWAKAGIAPESAVGQTLADSATSLEARSAETTKGMLERAANQSPAAVNAAWSTMPSAQRADIIDKHPHLVGNTNGIPSATRDEVNRSTLGAQYQGVTDKLREAKERRREELARDGRPSTLTSQEIEQLQEVRGGLDDLRDKLGSSANATGNYLLGIDSTANDRGTAIVAQGGNPDHADNTMTVTPGTYSDLYGATDSINEHAQVLDKANDISPEANNVAISWVGYESPDSIVPGAALADRAETGSPDLSEFQEGLRATHNGDSPSNNTLVGHSYGSTVVGDASHNGGSHADNIVFIGSPGVGADHVDGLDVPSDHVWSGRSGDDIIDQTPAKNPVKWVPTLFGTTDYTRYGIDPTDPSFGGQILPTAEEGVHEDYWSQKPSRDSMARIMTGNQSG